MNPRKRCFPTSLAYMVSLRGALLEAIDFFQNHPSPDDAYLKMISAVMGIILRYACGGAPPPPTHMYPWTPTPPKPLSDPEGGGLCKRGSNGPHPLVTVSPPPFQNAHPSSVTNMLIHPYRKFPGPPWRNGNRFTHSWALLRTATSKTAHNAHMGFVQCARGMHTVCELQRSGRHCEILPLTACWVTHLYTGCHP